jgi:hypothetical protein
MSVPTQRAEPIWTSIITSELNKPPAAVTVTQLPSCQLSPWLFDTVGWRIDSERHSECQSPASSNSAPSRTTFTNKPTTVDGPWRYGTFFVAQWTGCGRGTGAKLAVVQSDTALRPHSSTAYLVVYVALLVFQLRSSERSPSDTGTCRVLSTQLVAYQAHSAWSDGLSPTA